MLPLVTNGFSSHHLSLSDQKPFPPCELPPLSQTQVIFTPAHSFNLTASTSGFRVREGGSLSRSSVCGKAQSPLLLPVDRLRTPPTKMKLQDPSFSGDELPCACRHCPPTPSRPPTRSLAYVSGEGSRQKFLSLSLLLLPCVSPMLEVSESSLQVLDIIL